MFLISKVGYKAKSLLPYLRKFKNCQLEHFFILIDYWRDLDGLEYLPLLYRLFHLTVCITSGWLFKGHLYLGLMVLMLVAFIGL